MYMFYNTDMLQSSPSRIEKSDTSSNYTGEYSPYSSRSSSHLGAHEAGLTASQQGTAASFAYSIKSGYKLYRLNTHNIAFGFHFILVFMNRKLEQFHSVIVKNMASKYGLSQCPQYSSSSSSHIRSHESGLTTLQQGKVALLFYNKNTRFGG